MSGKQLNSTRKELFITLEYLLENCYDKGHTSKTIELTKYAKERYNVMLDRRRANCILEFLAECSGDFPNTFLFSVEKIPNKSRYYIERALFKKDETKKIAEAIFKDSTLSKGYSTKLLQIFLYKSCNKNDADKIIAKLNKKEQLVRRSSNKIAKFNLGYEMIRDEQLRFTFKTNTLVKMDACSSSLVYMYLRNLRHKELEDERYCSGFVYDIYPQGEDIDICVFLPDIDGAVILNIENIDVKKGSLLESQWRDVDYEIISDKYDNIDEMVNAYYKGEAGAQYDISFKFCVGLKDNINEKLLEKRKKDFEHFFSKEMIYELKERDVTIEDDPNKEPRHLVAVDLYSSIRCSFSSFKKWYWDYGLYDNLVVLSPASFNNLLLSVYVNRFKKRLEKYGKDPREEWLEKTKKIKENINKDGGN